MASILLFAVVACMFAVVLYLIGRNVLEAFGGMLICFLVCCIFYGISLYSSATRFEILGGEITGKERVYDPEREEYQCGTTQSCSTDSKGNRSCHSVPKYCTRWIPRWRFDIDSNVGSWYDYSYNKNRPPLKWDRANIGDPYANTKYFVNFQAASKQTVTLNTQVQYTGWLPEYPQIYDSWRVDRAMSNVIDVKNLSKMLEAQHKHWGPNFGIDVLVTIVSAKDAGFNHALASKWEGGKKNDAVLTLYVEPDTVNNGYVVKYAELFSRSTSNKRNDQMADFAMVLRENASAIGAYSDNAVIKAIGTALPLFEREDLRKYDYLSDEYQAPMWVSIVGIVFGLFLGFFAVFAFRGSRCGPRDYNPYEFWSQRFRPMRKHPDFR